MEQRTNRVAAQDQSPPDDYEQPRLTRVGSLRELLAGSTVSGTPDGMSGMFRRVGGGPPGM
jgi:hypothetical protein